MHSPSNFASRSSEFDFQDAELICKTLKKYFGGRNVVFCVRIRRKRGGFWLKTAIFGLKNGQKTRFAVTNQLTGKNCKQLNS
jgi:hypothetical protein